MCDEHLEAPEALNRVISECRCRAAAAVAVLAEPGCVNEIAQRSSEGPEDSCGDRLH